MTTEESMVKSGNSKIERMETRRTISPFDLTSSDNPGAIISYPLLTGNNYDEWSCAFKTALSSRKKFGFLDGTITQPNENSPEYEDWFPINSLLVSWIKMTIHDSLRPSISHRPIAKDLWESLKRRFSVSSGPKFQQLKGELAACKQHGQSVEQYYGRVTKIWDTMLTIRPIRSCQCGKCECKINELLEKDHEEDKVQQFLLGLDDNYQATRSALLSRVPLPVVEEAYNVIRQEEDMLKNKTGDRIDSSALAVRVQGKSREDKKHLLCKHCNRTGHLSDHCFAVVGYPEWWGTRPMFRMSAAHDKGHGQPATSIRSVTANVARTISSSALVPAVSDKDKYGLSGISDEQWAIVLRLMNANTSSPSDNLSGDLSGPIFQDSDWFG